jgi:zinc/manganese transport system permease protein
VIGGLAWHDLVSFQDYAELLPLVRNSLYAGAALGLVGGLVGVFVIARDLPFAVHGISELSFAGAAGALLLGTSVVTGSFVGSLVAALLIGVLGGRARERNSIIGVLMPFGLGLGILFLSLYQGRAANKFGLLTGQIVAIDNSSLGALLATAAVVLSVLAVVWRPLMFASVDPEMARARGVPVRFLSALFLAVLGCTVAISVQVVGALLVLALLCTPAAAAIRVTTSPVWMPLLSVGIALTAMLGGILLALGTAVPISPYVTTVAFACYLVCRLTGDRLRRHRRRVVPSPLESAAVTR